LPGHHKHFNNIPLAIRVRNLRQAWGEGETGKEARKTFFQEICSILSNVFSN